MERIQIEGRSLSGFKRLLGDWAKGKALEANRNMEKGWEDFGDLDGGMFVMVCINL